ncbi:hypothetical protein [Clostridium sp. MD294]|uniref:hypothetical protein n=1 Tax=Clostridium sp. MD294 TaxID=97138 RepID=UPI0002CAFE9B|nr:hypothetical protein [Clostridium sp. MD294]NDO46137.1 hypothetical protein [Clostridium sp. MD294]USF30197.1 hypothetical protein C820_001638 [Clostridium sp. MD294]
MEHKKYYPFVRNNYFYGKLLSVRDFQEEQKYFNDKRRLSNFLTTGAGVVSGMNVVLLDETTISLGQGFALDYTGREIIVAEAITQKLSTIKGFEELEDGQAAYLCIAYEEKEQELIHSVTGKITGENKYYNRIKEGYQLFLTAETENSNELTQYHLIEKEQVLFEQQGLKITQITPCYIQQKQSGIIRVVIEKQNLPQTVSVYYHLQCSGFETEKGESDISVYFQENNIIENQKTILEYTILAKSNSLPEEYLLLEKSSIVIGNENYSIQNKKIICETGKMSLMDYVIKKYNKKHFEDIVNTEGENKLYLAKINWIKQGEHYSITSIENMPFQQYVLSNTILTALLKQKQHLSVIPKQHTETIVSTQKLPSPQYKIESGTEIIEIDFYSNKKSYFSEEIAHGLGSGDVMIQTALEDVIDQRDFFNMRKNIFGVSSVFENSPFQTELPSVEIGVLCYPDKGTFRIGVQFKKDAKVTTIKVKWWALKREHKKQNSFAEVSNVEIIVEPNTIMLKPREKYKFQATLTGTESQECKWSIVEDNGGKIDSNGVYEAPSKEGVYEIVVESVKYSNKKATAFVVVKQI